MYTDDCKRWYVKSCLSKEMMGLQSELGKSINERNEAILKVGGKSGLLRNLDMGNNLTEISI